MFLFVTRFKLFNILDGNSQRNEDFAQFVCCTTYQRYFTVGLNAKIITVCSLEEKEGLNLKYIILFEN